jgi:hypothetical protein
MSIFDLRVGTCGCCEPPSPGTPELVWNRPGLDEVGYRVGRYPTFRQAAIQLVPELATRLAWEEGLAAVPLTGWTSRSSDDHGVALIEFWAVIGDVLTFYQERYANEAWLRTADHRDAVRRLAGLLGYRLRPGVSAATHVAVRLDDAVDLPIPTGLRIQSVPIEGQTPQTFETDAELDATGSLNRVPVLSAPITVTPLASGRSGATLSAPSTRPEIGDEVLLFTDGGGIEERSVARIDTVDQRPVVRWSRPLEGTRQRAFLRGRTFRLSGHAAPATWVSAAPSSGGTFLHWTAQTTDYTSTGNDLYLDGPVDGLEAGMQILVDDSGTALLRTVIEVAQTARTVGPQTATATRVRIPGPIVHDVRTTIVHELGDELHFQTWELPEQDLPAGTTAIFLPYPEVPAIAEGRVLILDDDLHDPLLAEVTEAVPHTVGGTTEYLRVELTAPTTRSLDAASAFALGNIVPASHGETIADETLGDGDASAELQTFTLKKGPVTHTLDPLAPGGARNSLAVYVDRVRWTERAALYGAGPKDRIYTTRVGDEQELRVRFGDGRTGSRLPSGRGNVVATYRRGIGTEGNLDVGQLATALDRPRGLDTVTNPLPATGGVDPESIDAARENAPNTVRTFDRAVSVRDFADLAREFTGVEKAHASWVWDGEERVVHVTIGGEDGAPLGPLLADVRTYLDARRDPNRAVRIGEFAPVPFALTVQVQAAADRFNEDVVAAVRAAVEGYFAYDRRAFGQAVHVSDVYAAVQAVPGVVSALVTRLTYLDPADAAAHGVGSAPVLVHAPVFGARHQRGAMLPAELATLVTASDLEIVVTGGLES